MLKRFLSYYRPYKGLFALDMGAAVLSSLLSIIFPMLTRELLRVYIPEKQWASMVTVFVLMFVIYALQMVFDYIRIRWGHGMGVLMEKDMRRDMFNHLLKLSFGYYDTHKTGDLMSRMTNDLFQIAEVAHHCPEDFLISAITILGSYAVMFTVSVPLSLVSLLPIPLLILWGIFFGRKLKKKYRGVRRTLSAMNSSVENSVQGIKEVKSFTGERYQSEKFCGINDMFRTVRMEQYRTMSDYHAVMNFLRNMCYFTTVVGGAILIYLGQVRTYDLVAFVIYVGVVLPPIDRLINFVEQMNEGIASFERFCEIMDIEPEIEDAPDAKELKVSSGEVEYRDLSFSYTERGEEVLSHINLRIRGGEKIAIVGESGAGKSTMMALLPRFYLPRSGAVLIDGQDVSDVTQTSLRASIGFVQQNVFLFDASIRENLLYGKHDASEEELWAALDAAALGEFVRGLPDGLDTEVGERGTRLSGGQKQRLTIARVFLKNPPILIFDEATSSLDSESEEQITEAFDRIAEGRTTIIIAHRLTTVIGADMIYVLDGGGIAEAGTHEELLKKGGKYAKLYRNSVFA